MNTEYLAHPFNISYNKTMDPTLDNYLGLGLVYSMMTCAVYKLYQITQHESSRWRSIGHSISSCGLITDNPDIPDDTVNHVLDTLLDVNSLDRAAILYYIFHEKGNFNINVYNCSGKIINISRNSYADFKAVEKYYAYSKLGFNLDETIEADTVISVAGREYHTTEAELRFISWVYYSGLFNYLINSDNCDNSDNFKMYVCVCI